MAIIKRTIQKHGLFITVTSNTVTNRIIKTSHRSDPNAAPTYCFCGERSKEAMTIRCAGPRDHELCPFGGYFHSHHRHVQHPQLGPLHTFPPQMRDNKPYCSLCRQAREQLFQYQQHSRFVLDEEQEEEESKSNSDSRSTNGEGYASDKSPNSSDEDVHLWLRPSSPVLFQSSQESNISAQPNSGSSWSCQSTPSSSVASSTLLPKTTPRRVATSACQPYSNKKRRAEVDSIEAPEPKYQRHSKIML